MSRASRKLAKAADRRETPGATSKDLTVAQTNMSVSPQSGPSAGITTGTGADWFGPQNPMTPVAPDEVKGRIWDSPSGYNLAVQTRAYEAIDFQSLRNLADAYDVLRIVIETRKDQMEKLQWSIKPRTLANGDPATSPDDTTIQEITDFFETPDRVNDWGTWLRYLLEDLFVIDAPTLYCRKTRAGKLFALEQLDGATVKRVIDDWGRTPLPPIVAYQQILKGFPAVNYTSDELIYLPRNPRTHKVYGFGPVEQILMIVNIGLRRELFQFQWYSEGSVPEALVGTPDDWTPKQISEFQNAFDAMLAGNQAARRRLKFVPGGVAKTYIQTKEIELTGKTDEWLARVVCYCFSVSPQPFVSMMNKATADTAHDAALAEGLAPLMNWTKRLIDRVIRRFWPDAKVEFSWTDDREVDAAIQQVTTSGYVANGIKTINEVRDELGLPPKKGGDELLVKTGTGYVPVDAPPPEPAAAPGALPPHSGASPLGEDPKPAAAEEAPATKLAGTFRKAAYWQAPRRHVASHASGAAGGKATRA